MSAPAAPEKTQPPASATAATDGAVAIKGRSPWEIVRARLMRDKITMTALVVSVLFLLTAILSPVFVALEWLKPMKTNFAKLLKEL